MIVYGQCEKEWAKQQMRTCRGILLKKKQRAPVCAVYLGPPDEKPSLGIRLPDVTYVSYKHSAIAHFLLAVQVKRGEPEDMKDVFISYNKADKNWAEWIAWILEEAGYAVVIQAWDFRPGGNFVLEMQRAATGTQKTIAVLSENYLRASIPSRMGGCICTRPAGRTADADSYAGAGMHTYRVAQPHQLRRPCQSL